MPQKKKNTQSGTEFARTKEAQAAIMREKQAKGLSRNSRGHLGIVKLMIHLAQPKQQNPWVEAVRVQRGNDIQIYEHLCIATEIVCMSDTWLPEYEILQHDR